MTPNQKSAILKKIGRPEGFNLPYHPKDIRPYLPKIFHLEDNEITGEDADKLRDAIYSIYAIDRDQQPYSENWVKEKEDALLRLRDLLKDVPNTLVCEKCFVGEDSLKFETRRICENCIHKLAKYTKPHYK